MLSASSSHGRVERPPFPPPLVSLLSSTSLAYLSTTDGNSPHLSLMNFTFCPEEQIIIMTTRTDSMKVRIIEH